MSCSHSLSRRVLPTHPWPLLSGPCPANPQSSPLRNVSQLCDLQLVSFRTVPREQLYPLMLHTFHCLTLMSCPDTKWQDLLPPVEGEEPWWASLYSTLVPQQTGEISWQLLHGAMSTAVYLARFTSLPDTCPFCSIRENLVHIYMQRARLQPLFLLLQNLLLRFWLPFSPHLLIYASPILAPRSQETSS